MNILNRIPSIIKTTFLVTTTAIMAVVLLLATHGVEAATPDFWQVKATKTTSGTINNSTFSKANLAGNLIVVHVLWGNTGSVTLTDTKNNTYTPVGPATRFDNNQSSSQMFYAKNIAAASANGNTLKATFGTSINNWAMVYAHEYSGMDKVSPVDVFGTTMGTGQNMSGTLTPHQNNSLIFGAAIALNGSVNGAGPGFNVRSTLSQDWTFDKVLPTAGSTNVTATRAGNGQWVLQMVAFKPDGTPPPNQPPSVSVTNPANSSLVKGSLSVTASASDPENSLVKVDFFVDGLLANTDTTAPYEFNLNTTALTNAQHTITAKASDGTNETTSAPIQTTVDNAAPSEPTNLRTTNLTSSQATLAWDAATDNLAVGGYKVFKDGVQMATTTSTSYPVNGLTPNTTYNFAVSAYDTVGNESPQTTPLPATTLPDTPPQITITSPTAGSIVHAITPVNATASDDVGVTQVELWVDDQLIIADAVAPYEFTLNTNVFTNDVHVIKTKAFDTLGQMSETSVTVTIDNLAPEAPTDLTAVVISSSAIDLSWTASAGDVASYKIFRNGSEIATNVTNTDYSDTGLTANTNYNYSVKAYDTAGNESPAATVSAATPPVPDTAPPVLSNGQPTGQQPIGTTTATLGVTTDEIATCRYATVAGTAYNAMLPNSFTTTGSTGHSAVLSGLNDGQSYTYFVRCQDGQGNTNLADFTINFSIAAPSTGGVAFPLRASSNGRYLEDQNGTPFLMMGDSPQGIIPSLNLSQVDTYLDNREEYGFNTLWINLLSRGQTGGPNNGATPEGELPFDSYLNGQVGNPEYYNLDSRNQDYFNRAKDIVRMAAERDMLVVLDPIETMDFLGILQRNGLDNAYEYGQYLGDQFEEFNNILWMHGNDFNTYMNDTDRALVRRVGEGIRSTDNTDAMQTVLGYASPSEAMDLVYNPGNPVTDGDLCGIFDPNPDTPCDMAWAPFVNIDTVYTYGPSYDYVAPEYVRAASYNDGSFSRGRIPVYLAETYYDFEDAVGRPNRTIKEFRWQQYWGMLSGGLGGHTYGNYHTVYLDGNWQPRLDTPAAANFSRLNQFFKSYPWHTLVPDQSVITNGAEGGDWNRATVSITENGSLAIAYIPNARTITINMARFNGQVTAKWFNPVTGTYIALGTFGNVGTQQFTPVGLGNHTETNWYGGTETSNDWVLVLETAPTVPDTQTPTVPTNLQATAQSSSQINLSWTPSTDNIAVTGYSVYRNGTLINGNVTATTFQDTGLAANTTYNYTVSSQDAASNNSAQSVSASATTQSPPPPDTLAPSIPTGLSAAVVSSSQINLGWNASTDNVGGSGLEQYRVYRSTDNVQFTELTPYPTGSGLNSLNLTPNTTYYYKVKAEDNAGNLSDFSATISATTQPAPSASAYLKAAWGFNEGSGTSTSDASGNNNTGTINGTSPWASGRYGSGLSLNGAGNYLSMPNTSSLDISGNEMTVSLWLNPQQSSSSDSIILGKFWNAASWTDPYYQYGLELWSGQPVFLIGTSTGLKYVTMGSNIAYDGQWKHITVVYNGADAKFYLNGVLVSTQPLTGGIVARGNLMNIGADQSVNQFFKGGLDDLRIYNKALTPAEIQADMNTSL